MKSLAIAYGMKRKKMAEGGDTSTSTTGNKTKTGGSNPGGASTGGAGTVTITTGKNPPRSINISDVGGKTRSRNAGGMDPSDQDDDMMAEGGSVESWTKREDNEKGINKAAPTMRGGVERSQAHAALHPAFSVQEDMDVESAKNKHRKTLAEMRAMKKPELDADGGCVGDSCPGCKMCTGGYAEGGDVMHPSMQGLHEQDDETTTSLAGSHNPYAKGGLVHTDDLVDRIMSRRANYSEGGRVANSSNLEDIAGFDPAEFDDLVLDDHLTSTYGKDDNAGDALGDQQEMDDRHDIVSRIMKQRSMKKNHNPRPA